MRTYNREEIKDSDALTMLKDLLAKSFIISQGESKLLEDNKDVSGFCSESINFCTFENLYVIPSLSKMLWISYTTLSWYRSPIQSATRINSITLYEGLVEYEKVRGKTLYGKPNADIPNLN